MDRRTIVFVILVSLTFVGFNFFFSHQQNERNRAARTSQTTEMPPLQSVALEELPTRSLTLEEGGEPVVYGIDVKGATLSIAWTNTPPLTVFINGEKQTLLSKESPLNAPILYAPSDDSQLDLGAPALSGKIEVQLFSSEPEPAVTPAWFKEGKLLFGESRPSSNALVLYKSKGTWIPLGFYERTSGAFVEFQAIPSLSSLIKPQFETSARPGDEKFYLLENEFVQLVFSNRGGALVEINLPFHSDHDPKSVVNEIGFDREIAEESPANARFPAHPYYTPHADAPRPPGAVGGYYPLIRRGIWNKKDIEISPQYYATNLVSEYPEMAELVYSVKSFTENEITFEATQPHRKITKTYTLSDAPYAVKLALKIDGDRRGLWLTSGVPEVEIMSNSSNTRIQYRVNRKGKGEVEKLSLPKPGDVVSVSSVYPEWVLNTNGYFALLLDPLSEIAPGYRAVGIPGNKVPTRLSVLDPKYQPYPASKYPGYEFLLPIPTSGGELNFLLFAGPLEESILKQVDHAAPGNPDYQSAKTFQGWFSFIAKPFAKLLFLVMSFFHTITHSWGIAIILLTVFLRLLLYPLNAWSIKSMRRMQKLSPQVQAIQARYKKEPKKAQIEIMTLYREKKVNPFTGCVPILIQIPFLIAMFDLLKSSFQLRGASFIPGWIDNLTAPDVLFQWQQPIFFIGNQFHLLPFLLGGVMFLQQRLTAGAQKDPSKMTDQQRQQKSMGTIMTVVFTVMFYHFPSGLNLYWLSSMSLGIFQQIITNKILDKKEKKVQIIDPRN